MGKIKLFEVQYTNLDGENKKVLVSAETKDDVWDKIDDIPVTIDAIEEVALE